MDNQLAQHLLEHSHQLIITLDKDGCICSINPFACEIFGQTVQELIGQNWFERYVPVAEQSQLKRHLQEVITYQLSHATFRHHVLDHQGLLRAFQWHHGYVNQLSGSGTVACLGQDVTELEDTRKRLSYLKDFDTLTQLPKLDLFKELFEHALSMSSRQSQKLALFFIDIDNLKIINDRYGHAIGDEIIQLTAQRLAIALQADDLLASFGGDEFVMLLEDASTQQILKHCGHIAELFEAPFNTQAGEILTSCSMGISMYPTDGLDSQTLFKNADIAKNRAKSDGKNQFRFYQSGMDEEIKQLHVMESELKKALQNREFQLFYQPQIDSNSKQLLACEALIRWNNPLLGSVSPADFIPFAEKSNLICPIGDWVLTESIAQHQAWKTQGNTIPISINVSPKQLESSAFVDRLLNLTHEYPLVDLTMIELEITETSMMKNPQQTAALLERIAQSGIRIAIDDFGTGYSSFASLKRGAFHKLKIDRSFITQMEKDSEDAVIVTAIIRMAETLGITIIAEGVEHLAQSDLLASLGCSQIQGYLYGRPMPADQVIEHMKKLT